MAIRGITFAIGLVVLCLIPNLVGDDLAIWASFLTAAILLLSLGLLVRVSGQISLCHLAFAAVARPRSRTSATATNLPWLLALLLAMLVALPVGAIVAIPAIRLSACSSPWRHWVSGSCCSTSSIRRISCSG